MARPSLIDWTPKIDRYILKNFHVIRIIDMANELDIDKQYIHSRIRTIVPDLHRQWKTWTELEDELLLSYWGKKPQSQIAKLMKRTENSCMLRVYQLEGMTDEAMVSGLLKPSDIAEIMGVDHKTVTNWVAKGRVECYRPDRKILIDENYFWKWVEDNTDRINYKRVEMYILNTAPEWYSVLVRNKQREIYKNEILNKYKTSYTSNEIAIMLHMKRNGASYREIGNAIGRTYGSVKCQFSKMQREKKVS